MMNVNEMYDELVAYGIASPEEIDLVTCINGFREEVLNDILYARTGYRDIDDYIEAEFDINQ